MSNFSELEGFARPLEGDFGKALLEEYNRRVVAEYGKNRNLDVLFYQDDSLRGSNPFAVVLINSILREQGLRTATQADLERILIRRALDLRGTYEDSALALRTDKDYYKKNEYLAKYLAKQLTARGTVTMPAMIPLVSLDLVNDENSPYGLSFNVREYGKIIHAPILLKSGNFCSEDVDEATGLPTRVGRGNRFLNKKIDGLSRLGLTRKLEISCYEGLELSDCSGLILVISNSVTY